MTETRIDRFLSPAVVADRTSLCRATLYNKVRAGDFPAPVKISRNRIAWPESSVAQWMADKMAGAQ